MSIFTQEEALELLKQAKVFYDNEPKSHDGIAYYFLNMNDTFAWALAYGASVAEDQLETVAELFWHYGQAGLNYWCTIHPEEDERMIKSEFEDIQRSIDFVKYEEELRLGGKSSDERAYCKLVYTLGDRSTPEPQEPK